LFLVGCISGLAEAFHGHKKPEITLARIKQVGKGVLAILIWLALYLFLEWYRSVGFLVTLAYSIGIGVFLWILAKLSPGANTALLSAVVWIFGTYDDNLGWIVGLWMVLLLIGVLYFLLFAPYGVLCVLGLRSCGHW
jgi:hypothetical protein